MHSARLHAEQGVARFGDALHAVRESDALGVRIDGKIDYDMPFIQQRKRALVKDFADYRIEGIETFPLFKGHVHFVSDGAVEVGDNVRLQAKSFVIATGSSVAPAQIPGLQDGLPR